MNFPAPESEAGADFLPPAELLDFINDGEKFLVAGHKEPDGDCIGSQLALVSALRRLGKEAFACSSGPFKKHEALLYEKKFISIADDSVKNNSRLIMADCGFLERTGDIASSLEGLPFAVIDHHASGGEPEQDREEKKSCLKKALYLYPGAPSTTCMIFWLIQALGLSPTKEEAELLFYGLCTDTGFFRHVNATGAGTFEIAAKLIKLGANPQKAFFEVYGGKTLDSRLLMGRVLANAESYFSGKLIISTESHEDCLRFGQENWDSNAIYQQFQAIGGVEAIVVISQDEADACSVSLRSMDKVDVGNIAKSFGGGGHKNASGISNLSGTIEEIKQKIIKTFEKEFGNSINFS